MITIAVQFRLCPLTAFGIVLAAPVTPSTAFDEVVDLGVTVTRFGLARLLVITGLIMYGNIAVTFVFFDLIDAGTNIARKFACFLPIRCRRGSRRLWRC